MTATTRAINAYSGKIKDVRKSFGSPSWGSESCSSELSGELAKGTWSLRVVSDLLLSNIKDRTKASNSQAKRRGNLPKPIHTRAVEFLVLYTLKKDN